MAEIKHCGKYQSPVNAGEERLLEFLKVNLPDNFYILPGIEIANLNPRNNQVQYLEYDCLVITPHAVYNIENKDYAGRLEGDDDFWYHKEKEMRNPHKTVRFKTSVLNSKLKTIDPSWSRVWIQSIVTLSHPLQNLSGLFGNHTKATFKLDENLIDAIKNPYNVGKMKEDIQDIYLKVTNEICGTAQQRKPEQRKEIEGYEILEVLDQEKNYTEYLVKPKGVTSAVRKRIKEYALDMPSLPEDKRQKREKQIKNQYTALHKIKTNPFILNVQFILDEQNHQFFLEITDYLDENSLRAELKRKTFTFEEKLHIIDNIITALKAAHEVGIFHRDISPENIFLTGGYACLGNFGKSYFSDHQEEGYTVQATLTEQTATAYHAMELIQKEASRASDIYSLGVLAYELFVGKLPFISPFELNRLGGKLPESILPSKINPALPVWIDSFCNHCIRTSPEDRWNDLKELEAFLEKHSHTEIIQQEIVPVSSDKEHSFEIGSRILDYTIYGKLGSGGYSQVYRVKHSLRSNTIYALKVFNESVHASSVIDEYEALKDIQHPNIVKFAWNGTLPSGQFFTLMEFLDGENLKDYAKGEKRLPIHRVFQVAKDILSALLAMQDKEPSLFHRDIKPQNIVFDKGERFVLIDFNVASALENNKEHVGTHPYLAPDLVADNYKVNWNKSADPFALGVTLYELACKAYPWNGSIKIPLSDKDPVHPCDVNPNLSRSFGDFIYKSIRTTYDQRFKDAKEMLQALENIGEFNIIEPEKVNVESVDLSVTEENFVSYINSLFSQSRHGNAGTRASIKVNVYDELTYTPTKLDSRLTPDILDGRYKLVIITGNAGDGKTAFIKKIETKAGNKESLEHHNGAKFSIKGTTFISNYDGSQDEEERANDQVLSEFFLPFEGLASYNNASEGRIIAINEGRLVEFLKTSGKFDDLANIIEEYFYKGGKINLPEGLLIINLNLRSVVASEVDSISLFKKQIKKLTEKPLWEKCTDCPAASKCFIRYNVETFNDSAAGDEIINRLEWLLRTAALKRELHITIRDLRSFISFILTRNYHCNEILDLYENLENDPIEWWKLHFFNITDASANDLGNQDRLINLLRETDIASVSAPTLDRDLFFGAHKKTMFLEYNERNFSLLDEFNACKVYTPSHEQTEESQAQVLEMHKVFRRHQFFEGKISFEARLPYRSVATFYEKLTSDSKPKEEQNQLLNSTLLNVSKAISLNEGCDKPEIYNKHLVLSSSHVNDPFSKSFRLFPLSDFELVISKNTHLVDYLEYEPDSLLFRNKSDNKVTLSISLDLYEMLDFIGKGYSPSLNDLRGKFIELQIFKNLLENQPYNKVVVTRDNREFYMVQLNTQRALEVSPLHLTEL
ncbi:MAG: serine/threonine protein kinase [Bacteroidetes bacterium]|nr:serine/threonine protein kinase [Bacteroidota bacterium]